MYLRAMIWFGLEEDQVDWTQRDEVEGDFSVFAESVSFSAFFNHLENDFAILSILLRRILLKL